MIHSTIFSNSHCQQCDINNQVKSIQKQTDIMPFAVRIIRGVGLLFLYLFTLGNICNSSTLKRWKEEVIHGKYISVNTKCGNKQKMKTPPLLIDPVHGHDATVEEISKVIDPKSDSSIDQHKIIIDESGWGKLTTEFKGEVTKAHEQFNRADSILLPGKPLVHWNWNWKEPPMNHDGSGTKRLIDFDDVNHYIIAPCKDSLPQVVILTLGRGYKNKISDPGVLRVPANLVQEIEKVTGIKKVLVLKTQAAIKRYNQLVDQGISVAAMVHTTC